MSPEARVRLSVMPFQVSVIVGDGKETVDAGGVELQGPGVSDPPVPVHVKVAVYDSAWALGAPTATTRTARIIHKDFRISLSRTEIYIWDV